ncbi:response regulator [candidate division KSB1 bacterium]|nr:response regulator [candidate division KSB1 bacterium]
MKLRALVLDDSRIMRNMIKRTLEQANLAEFEFTEAGDGLGGLELFNTHEFDILFVDWNMPQMTGIDFVIRVRADQNANNIPIVMVTSEKTMEKVKVALDEAGANVFISKPFTVSEMKFKLTPLLESIATPQSSTYSYDFFGKLAGGEK